MYMSMHVFYQVYETASVCPNLKRGRSLYELILRFAHFRKGGINDYKEGLTIKCGKFEDFKCLLCMQLAFLNVAKLKIIIVLFCCLAKLNVISVYC